LEIITHYSVFLSVSLLGKIVNSFECWKPKMLTDAKKKRNEQTEQAELMMGGHT
jgi:hypothetical protein